MTSNDDDNSSAKRAKTSNIVCISGPQWVDIAYFEIHYAGPITEEWNNGAEFVVGAAERIDQFAQQHLAELVSKSGSAEEARRVTVHDKAAKPGKDYVDGRLYSKFNLVNTYVDYTARDLAMARMANKLICVPPQFAGHTSGCMLVKLAFELRDDELALRIHKMLRSGESDAAYKQLLPKVKPIYQQMYQESVQQKQVAQKMAEAMGMQFVDV